MTHQQRALLELLVQLGEQGTAACAREKQAVMDSLVRNSWVAVQTVNGFKVWSITPDGIVALKRHYAENQKRTEFMQATSSAARASA